MDAALIQFLGSLAAILILAGIAWRLRLGDENPISNRAHAAMLADEVVSGFSPVESAIDASGRSAILRDGEGRVMVLRKHGAHFAGRVLAGSASASVKDNALHIETGERRYGSLVLKVENAAAWVQAIEAINGSCHA